MVYIVPVSAICSGRRYLLFILDKVIDPCGSDLTGFRCVLMLYPTGLHSNVCVLIL